MKGILFKPDMIRAILDGRKTQTRRVIKPQPTNMEDERRQASVLSDARYKIGETIYVKEAWADMVCVASTEKGKGKGESNPYYKLSVDDVTREILKGKWKSPMFMPEWASRIKLQITNVRIERVQDITTNDIISEGIKSDFEYRDNWIDLWDSINKPPYDWNSNPYVFVYEFKIKG